MAGAAADDSAQADDRVILAALCHLGRNQRNLERTRYPGNVNVFLTHVQTGQAIHCAAQQLTGDELVKTCGNDANLDVLRGQFSFKQIHYTHPFGHFVLSSLRYVPCASAWS